MQTNEVMTDIPSAQDNLTDLTFGRARIVVRIQQFPFAGIEILQATQREASGLRRRSR